MEENKNAVTQTEEKNEVVETVDAKVDTKAETGETKAVKTFTQEEVNKLLAKERKSLPSKEELEDFNKWKESQKSDEEKQAEKDAEYNKLKDNLSEKEKVIIMYENGIDKKYMDFLLFTVSKMDGDFTENLTNYIKENPEYGKKSNEETKATGVPVKTVKTQRSGVAEILAKKHPECNF